MANNEIKIVIGGDPSKFTAAAREVNNSLGRMRDAVGGPAGALPKLDIAVSSAANNLKSNIVPGANQATNAMLNLGRVVQDAPFGFIGIANNINPLLESFQRLKAETGTTGGAFKALAASLAGGAGLGLAISLVTSALTVFAMSGHGAKESLTGFAKAIDEANKKAGEELARVQVLNAVISDNTRSQSERSKAAKELSGILKDLNIDMSKEAILNGQVSEATKKATQAIIERAKARAIENRIGEITGEQLQRDLKRKEAVDKLTKATENLNTQQKIQGQVLGGSTLGVGGNTIAATQKVITLQSEITKLDKASADANKEIQQLISGIKADDLNIEFKGGSDKAVDVLKQRIAALKELQSLTGLDAKQQVELVQLEVQLAKRDAVKLGFTKEELKQQIDGIIEKAFPVKNFEFDTTVTTRINKLEISPVQSPEVLTKDFKTDIAKAIGLDGKPIEVPMPPVTITQVTAETQKALDRFKVMAVEATAGVADIIGQSLAEAINGESIGSILSNAAKGLMNIIGNILQEVGKNMILASSAVQALTTALNALFGPGGAIAGIAAGALLISVGALIKNIDIPKFADGGVVNRATLGIFGERGPEAIMPLNKIPELVGNLKTPNAQPIILQPSIKYSLTEFQLALELINNKRNRLG